MIFFSQVDQLDLAKMRQKMFLIKWCNFTGFSCMEESFILRNLFWKNGLPGMWSTKNRKNVISLKRSYLFSEGDQLLIIQKRDKLCLFRKQFYRFFMYGRKFWTEKTNLKKSLHVVPI
jgi:hypothetical protein